MPIFILVISCEQSFHLPFMSCIPAAGCFCCCYTAAGGTKTAFEFAEAPVYTLWTAVHMIHSVREKLLKSHQEETEKDFGLRVFRELASSSQTKTSRNTHEWSKQLRKHIPITSIGSQMFRQQTSWVRFRMEDCVGLRGSSFLKREYQRRRWSFFLLPRDHSCRQLCLTRMRIEYKAIVPRIFKVEIETLRFNSRRALICDLLAMPIEIMKLIHVMIYIIRMHGFFFFFSSSSSSSSS